MSIKARAEDAHGNKTLQVLVTPEQAAKWLATMAANRRLDEVRVERYAEEILAGRWDINGESIKVTLDDILWDGQHRCRAIVKANKPVWTAVFYGAAPNTPFTVDTGRPRKFSDILHQQGEANVSALAAAVRYCLLWSRYMEMPRKEQRESIPFITGGRIPGGLPTHRQLYEFLEKNPSIREAVRKAKSAGHGTRLLSGGIGAAIYHILSKVGAEDVDGFYDKISRGAELKETDAVFRLRARLLEHSMGRKRLMTHELFGLFFKAWNLWRKGIPCEILSIRLGGAEPEKFPVPE